MIIILNQLNYLSIWIPHEFFLASLLFVLNRLSGYLNIGYNQAVYLSERATADRNFALAHFMVTHSIDAYALAVIVWFIEPESESLILVLWTVRMMLFGHVPSFHCGCVYRDPERRRRVSPEYRPDKNTWVILSMLFYWSDMWIWGCHCCHACQWRNLSSYRRFSEHHILSSIHILHTLHTLHTFIRTCGWTATCPWCTKSDVQLWNVRFLWRIRFHNWWEINLFDATRTYTHTHKRVRR